MSGGASPAAADRRSAHFVSLLTWGRDDLDRVWRAATAAMAGAAPATAAAPGPLAGKRVVLCWESPDPALQAAFAGAARAAGAAVAVEDGPPGQESGQAPGQLELLETRLSGWGGAAAVVYRAAAHARLLAATPRSPAPVVSGGTPGSHPFRVLADLFGLAGQGRPPDGLRAVWLGAPAAELQSWLEGLLRFDLRLDVALPDPAVMDPALAAYVGVRAGSRLGFPADPAAALPEADVVILGGDAGFVARHRGAARRDAVVLGRSGDRPWGEASDAAVARALLVDVAVRAASGGEGA